MSETQELTYSDVSEHSSKKVRSRKSREPQKNHSQLLTLAQSDVQDLYLVVHDKVYNASAFVDEHPYVPDFSPPPPHPYHSWGKPPLQSLQPLMVKLLGER